MKPSTNPVEYRENPVFMELVSILGNGFILSLFNIDFLFFEYLFPIVGSGIMLYGCHLVKDYNRDFLAVYYLAYARFILMLFNFLLDWTSINTYLYIAYLQIASSAIIIIILFIYLDKAFASMYQDAGINSYRHVFFKYIPLYLCTVVSTYLTISIGILGALISIIILLLNVLYIGLVFNRTGKDLTSSNLEISFTSYTKKMVHKHYYFIATYVLLLAVTIYFSNKETFFLFQKPNTHTEYSNDCEEIKSKLQLFGMKSSVIKDLAPVDLRYLATATSISSQTDMREANGGMIQFITYHITLEDGERMLIYYDWIKEPSNRLFQILEFTKGNRYNICEISSRCLYTDNKTDETMELPVVEKSINVNGNPYTNQKLSNEGNNLRGYLSFSYIPASTSISTAQDTRINFYYQVSIFNLPYLKITDYMDHYDKYETNIVYNRLTIPITKLTQ